MFFDCSGDQPELNVRTHSCPTRRSSDLTCGRDAVWTPATAASPDCGLPVSEAPVVAPTASNVVLNADTFFDFDKSTIKPEGRQILDQVASQADSINLETVIATGHTDSIGTEVYNQGLSERRANSVKTYLVSKGIAADRKIGRASCRERVCQYV